MKGSARPAAPTRADRTDHADRANRVAVAVPGPTWLHLPIRHVVATWQALPTPLARYQWVLVIAACTSIAGLIPSVLTSDVSLPHRCAALLALCGLGALWVRGYRRGRLPMASLLLEALAIALAGSAAGDPQRALSVMYSGLFFRALFARGVEVVLVPIALILALAGAVAWSPSAAAQGTLDLVAHTFGLGQNAIVMHFLRRALQKQEQTESNLREANVRAEQALVHVIEREQTIRRQAGELRVAQQQVIQQERLRALGQMAAGIAHDLNNALAPVVGFAELLLVHPSALENTATARHYLQLISTGSQDAANVVSRLREFYRQREDHEVFGAVDLPTLATQIVRLTAPKWKDQALASGRTIVVDTDLNPVPPVAGNDSQLREVLTNLIFNAVDAIPQAGTITLRTFAAGAYGGIEVTDTGLGMSEEIRLRCLEPFFSTKGERGTGLGLAMVHGTVQRHGGTLEIDSVLGQGTTIRLLLPLSSAGNAGGAGDAGGAAATAQDRPLHVLVVDDEPSVRAVTVAYLEADGHVVHGVSNGLQACEYLEQGAIDLIVSDRAMPGMSGDELALTAKRLRPEVPFVLLTGFGGLMHATDDVPPGVDCVAGKPITLARLRDVVAAVTTPPAMAA